MGKPIIYVAHPVSGDVKANCDKVLRWLRWLTEVDPSRIYIAPWVGEVLAHLDLDPITADFYDRYQALSEGAGVGFFQIGGGIAGDFPICVVPSLKYDLQRPAKPWAWKAARH